ncbi:MAG: hypothetical protein JSW03_00075 [Candidatus Eiseniibacteriota bacterium]|nr:MAG: hypothetical protein JSW03_00075 [Candidatus Eisenbacteria bacterium]
MAKIFGQIEKLINEHGSATILRERLDLARDQYEALERKNAELEGENETLRRQVAQLEKENEKLEQALAAEPDITPDFDEVTQQMLLAFFKVGGRTELGPVATHPAVRETSVARYHCDLLQEAGFVMKMSRREYANRRLVKEATYQITSAGRKYVVKNKLHERET